MKTQNEKNQTAIESICFPVEKIDQRNLNPNFIYGSEYTHAIIAKVGDQKHYLNACSNRYALVENSAFIPELYDIISTQFGANNVEVNVRNWQNAQFNVDFIIKSETHYFAGNAKDPLNFKISASNSYNGKQNYNFKFGNQVYRQICTNGLHAWRMDELFSVKGKHTDNIKLQLKNFKVNLLNALDQDIFNKIAASFQPMLDNLVIDLESRLTEVMEFAGIGTTPKNMDHVINVITNEADQAYNGQINDWLIYNGLNNLLFNTDTKASQQSNEFKDKKVFEFLMPY